MSIKISTPGCGPHVPPDLYSTQEGHPSWFPLVLSDWGIWASPPETDWNSYPGGLPLVPLDLVSPQEGFSPGPFTPRLKCFPATRILPILLFVCFLCGTWYRTFMWNHCQLEEFINNQIMMDRALLWAASFLYYTSWRLKMCIWWLYFSTWSPKGDLRIFFILSPVPYSGARHRSPFDNFWSAA